MNAFEKSKKEHLNKLYQPDKSRKGEVDKPIKSLINTINKKDNYFTTSSCSGRNIILINKEKRHQVKWLYVSHEKINFEKIKEIIKENVEKTSEIIWFKFEAFILHIACKNINSALNLIKLTKALGLKRSGIITSKESKTMVEIIGSEQLDVPISKDNKLLVSDEFIKLLIEECNSKLESTHEKIDLLEEKILKK